MTPTYSYTEQCREEAEDLGSYAARWHPTAPHEVLRRGLFARVAARAAFVALGLRPNKASSTPVLTT